MSELFKADNINRYNEWAAALRFIHDKAMDIAKTELVSTGLTVTEIAYKLGFQYPQHFLRLFKKEMRCTPNEYRMQLLSDK